jgi:hypothetical protein
LREADISEEQVSGYEQHFAALWLAPKHILSPTWRVVDDDEFDRNAFGAGYLSRQAKV